MKTYHCLALALLFSTQAFAADAPGSKDHAIITRFKGAEIKNYDVKNYDESLMLVKPLDDDTSIPAGTIIKVEGKVTRIGYSIASNNSPLEVMANYEQALAAAHLQTLFKCSGAECGKSEGVVFGGYLANSGKIKPVVMTPPSVTITAICWPGRRRMISM